MAESLPAALGDRWRPGARFLARVGRRTLVESLYLLTAPVTAAAGLLLVLGGLCAGAAGLLLPGGSPGLAGGRALVRRSAGLERWRIAKVRAPASRPDRTGRPDWPGQRPGPDGAAAAAGPGLWLDVAHAMLVLPVVLVTSVLTALWWSVGVATITFPLRSQSTTGSLRPNTFYLGSPQSHIALSLGLTSPDQHLAFALTLGLVLLCTLPLVTRACVAVQAGLGQAMLSDVSALYRRISGLERERDAARAQTVAAVTAEAAALRRLERDIHDGPQQRLVRLAMELGRAQHHFDSRPEAVRAGPRRRDRADPGGAGGAAGPVAWHRPAGPRRPRPAGGGHRAGRALDRTRRARYRPAGPVAARAAGRGRRDGRVFRDRRGADQRGQAQPRPPVRRSACATMTRPCRSG